MLDHHIIVSSIKALIASLDDNLETLINIQRQKLAVEQQLVEELKQIKINKIKEGE